MNPAFERASKARLLWMQVRCYGSLSLHHLAEIAARKACCIVE